MKKIVVKGLNKITEKIERRNERLRKEIDEMDTELLKLWFKGV